MAVEHFTPDIDGDENLVQIAALTPTDNAVIIGNGSAWTAESGSTLRQSLGLAIGVDVQAYDADLAAWAGVNPSSYLTTAAAAAAYQPLDSDLTSIGALTTTSYGRGHLTLADAAAGRTYYGLGTAALVADSGLVHISGTETVTGTKTFTATQTKIAPTVGSGADPADAAFVVQAPGAGNSGPYIVLQSNSATPTAGDVFGVRYFGKDSAANDQVYGSVNCAIMDPTSTTEDSELRFATIVAGTFANRFVLGAAATFSVDAISTNGAGLSKLTATGDIYGYRSGGTSGYHFFNSASTAYLGFDGTNFVFITPGGGTLNWNGDPVMTRGAAETVTGAKIFSANIGVGVADQNLIANRVNGLNLRATGEIALRTANPCSLGLSTSSGQHFYFYTDNGSAFVLNGNISSSGGTTSYNTTSDEFLKDHINDAAYDPDWIMSLRIREFEFKAFPGIKYTGFIAQELAETESSAVTPRYGSPGEDDFRPASVDPSKLIYKMALEMQRMRSRLAALEASQ